MDRLHAELLGDELADEAQRQVGSRSGVADLLAVDPRHAVAVMPVGDEDIVACDTWR